MANVVLIDPEKPNTSFPMQDGRSNKKKKGTIHQQDHKSYLLIFLQQLFCKLSGIHCHKQPPKGHFTSVVPL